MNLIKKNAPLIIRILISGIFLLSAVAKAFPIWAFEKQLVDLGIVDWCQAPYLSRLIIALELAIAIAILQRHYIKSFVIPVTILLLVSFCIHLGIQMVEHGAMNGNCGCFGQLIPMTPLEAMIKNIITILMLVYLFRNTSDYPKGDNRFVYILCIYFLSAFLLFFIFPFCPCTKTAESSLTLPSIDDSIKNMDLSKSDTTQLIETEIDSKKDTWKKQNPTIDSVKAIQMEKGPAKVQSKYAPFTQFSGRKVNLDDGKKIVCLFVPGCDHCREAAKEIAEYGRKYAFPPVYILFMNEETFKIPEFFAESKLEAPYFIINDIPTFFKLLGNKASTPGVDYLWNGNIIKSYEGIESHKFNAEELVRLIFKKE